MDNGNEKNLTNIYKKLFKLFFINEINKINELEKDNNSTKSNSNLSYFNFNAYNQNNEIRNFSNISAFEDITPNREIEVNDLFSTDEFTENMICPFWDVSKISINNINNNNNNIFPPHFTNLNNYLNPQNPFKSNCKSTISQDDIYSLDFQGRYFIEK